MQKRLSALRAAFIALACFTLFPTITAQPQQPAATVRQIPPPGIEISAADREELNAGVATR